MERRVSSDPGAAAVLVAQPSSLTGIPTERLEAQICELAANVDAASCRLVLLIGELDRREAWRTWECRSAAHWLSWKAGLSLVTAREHVRIGRALVVLPAIRAAFAAGELSYSKARALTRVALPETEIELLELARATTGAGLDKIVASYRKHGQEGAAVAAHEADEDRDFRWWHDDDGSLVFHGRVPADQAPTILAMLATARAALAAGPLDDIDTADAGHADAGHADAGHADAGRADASRSSGGGPPDTPAGVSGRAPEPGQDQPESASAAASGACVVRPPTLGARNADALVLAAEAFLAHGPARRAGGDRTTVTVIVDAATLAADEHDVVDGECTVNDQHAPAAVARRLGCECTAVALVERDGLPIDAGPLRRIVNRRQKRALRRRDGGCRVPGCTNGGFLDAHHLVHWANGGPTVLANLLLLCDHHHRCVHEGGWTITGSPAGELTFHRPDRTPLTGPRPRARSTVEALNFAAGLTIDARTNESAWDNQPFEMSDIIWGLDERTRRARHRAGTDHPDPPQN